MIYQNCIRTMFVLLTVIVALRYPFSASMLGAVGGLTDAFQCFVLPPMIYLQITTHFSKLYRWYNCLIILFGVGIILYTIVFSLKYIF
jgi:hypothetical protein